MSFKVFKKWLQVCVLAGYLAGCALPVQPPVMTPTGEGLNPPVPSQTETAEPVPLPTAKSVPTQPIETSEPEIVPTSAARPASGWTTFSNPDFVRGVVVVENQLWSATLGGVAVWNLETNIPTLFTPRDGLVEIQGNAIAHCSAPDQRIWVAHESSMLSVYDLQLARWNRVPITFADGSTMHSVRSLYCDSPRNRLLAASEQELAILNMETMRWERFGQQEGLQAAAIRSLDVAGSGIWVASGDQGAFLIMGSTAFPFNRSSGFPAGAINDLAVSPEGTVWFGYPTGLVRYVDRKWDLYSAKSPTGLPFDSIDHVELGAGQDLWIASGKEGVCPFDTVRMFCFRVYPAPRDYAITDLTVNQEGIAFVGTDGGGILGLYGDEVRTFAFNFGQLASNNVYDIAESADGRLYIATDRGVNILDLENPQAAWEVIHPTWNPRQSVPHVVGLQPQANGMWFFYDQEPTASFYDGQNWLHLDLQKGIPGPLLSSIVDWNGRLWLGSGQGLVLWDDPHLRPFNPQNTLPGNVFQSFLRDGEGMWVGTDMGLLHYERYQWRLVLRQLSVRAIAQDGKGGLLVGTDQGLVRMDGQQVYLWVIPLLDEVLTTPQVTSIAWDGSGNLWVGTENNGLLMFDGSRWESFNTANGMPTNTVRKIFADRMGTIWVAMVTGHSGGALLRFVP
jgi:ligand-binding sensor domain-containing protein